MPTFRDINKFNSVSQSEVNPDWAVQVSSTQKVTLRQIANLVSTPQGNSILLDGFNLTSDAAKKSLTAATTVTDAFEKLMQMLGGGYNDQYSKLQVIGTKSSSYLYHILRLMETVSNKNLDFVTDPSNKVVGFLFDNTGTSATTALNTAFKFQAKAWSALSSGTSLAPNQVHTSGMTNAVTLTKSAWDAVNIGSAALMVGTGSAKTLSAIVNTLVSTVKSSYTVYGPNSDQYDLLDSTANVHMILVQKLGTYLFITVSPMTRIT